MAMMVDAEKLKSHLGGIQFSCRECTPAVLVNICTLIDELSVEVPDTADIQPRTSGTIREAFDAIRAAGGSAWDELSDEEVLDKLDRLPVATPDVLGELREWAEEQLREPSLGREWAVAFSHMLTKLGELQAKDRADRMEALGITEEDIATNRPPRQGEEGGTR